MVKEFTRGMRASASRRQVLQGLGAGAVALGASGTLAGRALAQTKKLTQLSVTYGPTGVIYCPSAIAIELGFARDEGLDLKLVVADGGAKARQILAAGEADFGHGDTTHPLQISNRGKPCRMLQVTETICSYANIVVRKDLFDQGINTPEKLGNWKRPDGAQPIVAATAIGSGTWLYGTYIFEKAGVGDKINWVSGGGTSTMLGGLQSKRFDAIMCLPAWQYESEQNNWGRAIFDALDGAAWTKTFGGPMPISGFYAQKSTIDQKAELTQAFINAEYKAMQWLKKSSVDEIWAKIGDKYMNDYDPASGKRELVYYLKAWHYAGTFNEAEFANGGKVWYRDGTDIKPTPFAEAADPRFIENAVKKFG